ncbi:MAG: hypothetical protein VKL42_02060 [Snowella sp.]|nr:hypothetical protein [Snowella sp.]
MWKFSKLVCSLGLITALITVSGLKAQAQNDSQVSNTLSYEKKGQKPTQLSVSGTVERVNSASVVGAISLGGGVELDAVQTAINLTLAGANPDAVSNLMLAMGGMVSGGNQVDPTRLALAINAFNSIIDKADADTLNALQELPEFTDIRAFLVELRKPIS